MHPITLRRLWAAIILSIVGFFLVFLLSEGGALVEHQALIGVGVIILGGALLVFLILVGNVWEWHRARGAFRRLAEHHQAKSRFHALGDFQGTVSFAEGGMGVEIALEVRRVALWPRSSGQMYSQMGLPELTVALTPSLGLSEDFAIHLQYSPFADPPKELEQLRKHMEIEPQGAPWLESWLDAVDGEALLSIASFWPECIEANDGSLIFVFRCIPTESEAAERLVQSCRSLCDSLVQRQSSAIDARFTLT